jgi:hypothetical protein
LSFDASIGSDETGEAGTPELSNEQLRAQLASAEERATRGEQDLDRERGRLDTFLARSPQQEEKRASEPLPPMPDPVEETEKYRAWLVEKDARVTGEQERRLKAHTEEIRHENAEAETRAEIWSVFENKYPSHAAARDLASAAYSRLNTNGSLPSGTSNIVTAVAREMDRMVGTPIDKLTTPPDRTGGTSAGNRPAPTRPKAAADDDTIVSIHSAASAFKMKHGLI